MKKLIYIFSLTKFKVLKMTRALRIGTISMLDVMSVISSEEIMVDNVRFPILSALTYPNFLWS